MPCWQMRKRGRSSRTVVHVDEQNRIVKIGNDAAEPVPGSDQLRGDLAA